MQKLLDIIKEHEGFKSKPYTLEYKTSDGENVTETFKTIGYGFRMDYLEIDEEIAEMILLRKIHEIEKNLDNKFEWYDDLPESVRDGVISIVYQLGLTSFMAFRKTIGFISEGKWEEAADEALDSRWAVQTPSRAKAVTDMIRNG